jgi:hypothetical protein
MPEWFKIFVYSSAVVAAIGLMALLAELFGWL